MWGVLLRKVRASTSQPVGPSGFSERSSRLMCPACCLIIAAAASAPEVRCVSLLCAARGGLSSPSPPLPLARVRLRSVSEGPVSLLSVRISVEIEPWAHRQLSFAYANSFEQMADLLNAHGSLSLVEAGGEGGGDLVAHAVVGQVERRHLVGLLQHDRQRPHPTLYHTHQPLVNISNLLSCTTNECEMDGVDRDRGRRCGDAPGGIPP